MHRHRGPGPALRLRQRRPPRLQLLVAASPMSPPGPPPFSSSPEAPMRPRVLCSWQREEAVEAHLSSAMADSVVTCEGARHFCTIG
jgi:hypothetical protein